MSLDSVARRYQTVWEDFVVQSHHLYHTELEIDSVNASANCELVALNFARYNGFNGFAYGESSVDTGITEQQAYDLWITEFDKQQRLVKNQMKSNDIKLISQSVYDGIVLLNWATGNVFNVDAVEGQYNLLPHIKTKAYDTVADMIKRSDMNNEKCIKAATVLRLADYGKTKNRTWMRTNGIYNMRDQNEKNLLSDSELRKARYAYYAETLKFLPFTPESIKRDISNKYNKTLIRQTFTYSGTTTFTLNKTPSMTPVEKLQVIVNGDIIQHLFDFTVSGTTLSITKTLQTDDFIETIVKI